MYVRAGCVYVRAGWLTPRCIDVWDFLAVSTETAEPGCLVTQVPNLHTPSILCPNVCIKYTHSLLHVQCRLVDIYNLRHLVCVRYVYKNVRVCVIHKKYTYIYTCICRCLLLLKENLRIWCGFCVSLHDMPFKYIIMIQDLYSHVTSGVKHDRWWHNAKR